MTGISTLHDRQAEGGARFGFYHDWEIAEDFGDPVREYTAIRENAGVLDLCYLGELRVSGRDRVRFLHNLLSNDIMKLVPGTGCYATLLTHQGRMESDLYVYAFEDEFLLECPPSGHERVLQSLNRSIVSDKVEIEDTAGRYGKLSVQGPLSAVRAGNEIRQPLDGLSPLEHRTSASGALMVIRRDRTGCGGYDLRVPVADIPVLWARLCERERLLPVGHRALDWLRTEAGIPWFGIDMDGHNLPMEMGLDAAISLTKGCYRGQEIVARVTYRGRLDRRLGGVTVRHIEPPKRGCGVFASGIRIGEITSAILSPRLRRPLALALLKSSFLSSGTAVEIDYGTVSYPGEVVTLPLA